jgi:hypothetical protein
MKVILILILQIRKLRHRKVKDFAQIYKVVALDFEDSQNRLLTTTLKNMQ